MKNCLYCIIFIVLPFLCKSQNYSKENKHQIDSINAIISNINIEDTLLADAYLSLNDLLYMTSFDTMYYLSNKAREVAEKGLTKPKNEAIKLSLMRSLAAAYGNMGYVLKYRGKNDEALSYYQKSLELSKKTNDLNGLSSMYNNIGLIYGNQGNIKKALEYYNQCLKIRIEIDDKKGLATIYNNIGAEYRKQGDNNKTLEYYKKSMSYSKQINDERNLGRNLNNIGFVYYALDKKDTALLYWNESLTLRKKIGDEYGIAESLTNLALVEENNDKLDIALDYLVEAFNKYEKLGVKNSSVSQVLSRISGIYYKKNKVEIAINYGMKGLALAQDNGFLDGIMANTNNLYIINKGIGKDKIALKMHELYIAAKDSIQSNINRQEVLKNEYKFEYEKQYLTDSIAFAKQKEIKEIEISKQKTEITAKRNQQFVLFGGLFIVLIFAGVTYNRFKMSQTQKNNN